MSRITKLALELAKIKIWSQLISQTWVYAMHDDKMERKKIFRASHFAAIAFQNIEKSYNDIISREAKAEMDKQFSLVPNSISPEDALFYKLFSKFYPIDRKYSSTYYKEWDQARSSIDIDDIKSELMNRNWRLGRNSSAFLPLVNSFAERELKKAEFMNSVFDRTFDDRPKSSKIFQFDDEVVDTAFGLLRKMSPEDITNALDFIEDRFGCVDLGLEPHQRDHINCYFWITTRDNLDRCTFFTYISVQIIKSSAGHRALRVDVMSAAEAENGAIYFADDFVPTAFLFDPAIPENISKDVYTEIVSTEIRAENSFGYFAHKENADSGISIMFPNYINFNGDNTVPDHFKNTSVTNFNRFVVPIGLAFLMSMDNKPIQEKTEVPSPKLNKKRVARGDAELPTITYASFRSEFSVSPGSYGSREGSGSPRRRHAVVGHPRRLASGKTTFVKPHIRGLHHGGAIDGSVARVKM